jgi:hypothetical protein
MPEQAKAGRIEISASNNYVVCLESTARLDDSDFAEGNDKNNTIIFNKTVTGDPIPSHIAALDENMLLAGLDASLTTEDAVPYLKIKDKSSPLVNAGINSYVAGSELVPTTDIIGTTRATESVYTGSKVDIGAFEFVGDAPTSLSGIDATGNELATVYQNNGTLTIQNNTNNNLTVKILRVDGRQIYAASVQGSVSVNKSELSGGILLVVISDGTTSSVKKIAL